MAVFIWLVAVLVMTILVYGRFGCNPNALISLYFYRQERPYCNYNSYEAILGFLALRGDTTHRLSSNLAERSGLQAPYAVSNFTLIAVLTWVFLTSKPRILGTYSPVWRIY